MLDSEGHRLAGDGGGRRCSTALDDAVGRGPGVRRSVAVARPDGPSYVAVALAGTEHLGTLLLHGRARRARRSPTAAPSSAGALVTALVLLFGRIGRRGRGAGRAASCSATCSSGATSTESRLRERARRQQADLDGPTAWSPWPPVEGVERHRAAQVAARLGGELQRPGRRARRPGGAGRAGRGRRSRSAGSCASGCARPAAAARSGWRRAPSGPAERRRRRTPRPGAAWTRWSPWAATGEVSDPAGLGLARLLLGQNGPEELDAFIESQVGPVLAYDERRGTELVGTLEAWFAAGARPAETAKRLHVHPNTVAQRLDRIGTLLGDDWRDPARGLDVQLALRLCRLRAR